MFVDDDGDDNGDVGEFWNNDNDNDNDDDNHYDDNNENRMQNVLDKKFLSGDRNSFCGDDVADFGGQNQIPGVHSSGTDSFNPFDVRTII